MNITPCQDTVLRHMIENCWLVFCVCDVMTLHASTSVGLRSTRPVCYFYLRFRTEIIKFSRNLIESNCKYLTASGKIDWMCKQLNGRRNWNSFVSRSRRKLLHISQLYTLHIRALLRYTRQINNEMYVVCVARETKQFGNNYRITIVQLRKFASNKHRVVSSGNLAPNRAT